ncbi:ParB/RepB/Spo0J family partition protein [Oceaniglobus trochenteri]|uniref:ParB/RepB/Spo0J family partition protein n=1 Tax=Oceaniglobus trochenteri TaxID=2763260 RepID=UPI001CFF95B1|nr:ParB N-terminal domain-containing protein [Oceaniglobus trochenteri]
MVKRRPIEAPTPEELSRYEAEFRRETKVSAPPIAQVSAAAARAMQPASADIRAEQARDRTDADRLRNAEARGLVMAEIPLDEIAPDILVRDRTVMDKAELDELKSSIATSGLRLPIEIYPLPEGEGNRRFGLLSGYRRLLAVRELLATTGDETYRTIRALVRDPQDTSHAMVSMVEENEVRAALSQFERGRIAAISAKQGAFDSTEAAVNALFAQASKAKRSKVRSFALIFEELGDMLSFPEALTEKQGLRLATALRDGAEPQLRAALAAGAAEGPQEEWALLEAALEALTVKRKPARGGRPRSAASGWDNADTLRLENGVVLRRASDASGHTLRIEGNGIDDATMDQVMREVQRLLEGR